MAWDPHSDPEGGWATVQYRRGRRRNGQQAEQIQDRHRDASHYRGPPAQERSRTYASVTRYRPPNRSNNFRAPHGRFQPPGQPRPRSYSWNRNAARGGRNQQQQQRRYAPQHHQPSRNSQHQQSNDPLFTVKVRALHRLLKATHHLKNVSHNDHDPPAIQRITEDLTAAIKPANPSLKTQQLIKGNAKNWAWNTILVLRQHYEEARTEEKKLLEDLGGDLLAPLEVAIKWAKRNLGRRFNLETADEVQMFLASKEEEAIPPSPSTSSSASTSTSSTSHCAPSPPGSCSSATSHPEQSDQTLDSDENLDEAPHLSSSHLTCSPSATPPPSWPVRPAMVTSETMTDPWLSDWTPPGAQREENEGSPGPPPPPAEAVHPLPQRRQRSSSPSRTTTPAPQAASPAPPGPSSSSSRRGAVSATEGELCRVSELLREEVRKYRTARPAAVPLLETSSGAQLERRASLRPRLVPLRQRLQICTQRQLTFDPRRTTAEPVTAPPTSGTLDPPSNQLTVAARQIVN